MAYGETQPREGIELITPAKTYRIATGTRDIQINGETFRADPAGRDGVSVSTLAEPGETAVHLPLVHPLVQRYLAGGIAAPPREILVNVYRIDLDVAGYEPVARGVVTAMTIDGHVAKFVVRSLFALAFKRRLPAISAGRRCLHVLYDSSCRADRDSFTVSGTVAAVDGRKVRVDVALDEEWALGGELVHVPSGEPMTIYEHKQTIDLAGQHANLTLQEAVYGMQVGDAVTISAGCPHDITTCRSRFNNALNYGGFPQLPTENPFTPTGLGLLRSL